MMLITTVVSFSNLGPMTGKLSESCSIACKAVKMYCEPLMKQEDPMEMYAKGKSPCNDSTSNPRYSELYHPSYVQNIGRCEGFLELPRLINCSASPPDDGQTVRLCHCVSSGRFLLIVLSSICRWIFRPGMLFEQCPGRSLFRDYIRNALNSKAIRPALTASHTRF